MTNITMTSFIFTSVSPCILSTLILRACIYIPSIYALLFFLLQRYKHIIAAIIGILIMNIIAISPFIPSSRFFLSPDLPLSYFLQLNLVIVLIAIYIIIILHIVLKRISSKILSLGNDRKLRVLARLNLEGADKERDPRDLGFHFSWISLMQGFPSEDRRSIGSARRGVATNGEKERMREGKGREKRTTKNGATSARARTLGAKRHDRDTARYRAAVTATCARPNISVMS